MTKEHAAHEIFIVGNPRSGTSMMRAILGNHPEIYAFQHELHFFEGLCASKNLYRRINLAEAAELTARLLCVETLGWWRQREYQAFLIQAHTMLLTWPENVLSPIEIYKQFLHTTATAHERKIPCDKTPQYIFYLHEIFENFPQAKVIHLIRDPRDVLHSQKYRWKQQYASKRPWLEILRTWGHYHPTIISYLWRNIIKTSSQWVADPRVYIVKFEDILQNPEEELRKICTFFGLAYTSQMLEVPIVKSSCLPDRLDETGIDATRTQQWRQNGLNSAELFLNQVITSDAMKQCGYAPVKAAPNLLLLISGLFTFPVKLLLTFFLHASNLKNLKETVKRRLRLS